MLNISKSGTKIIGKTFSYRLNAIIDSYIARGLMQTLSGQDLDPYSDETRFRIDAFTDIADKINHSREFLLGVAFAQYYVNASWDILYPKMFEAIFPRYFSQEVKNSLSVHYEEISETDLGLDVFKVSFPDYRKKIAKSLKSIGNSSFGDIEELMLKATGLENLVRGEYRQASKTDTQLDFSQKKSFLLGIYLTQELNREHNAYVFGSNNKKSQIIAEASKNFTYPEIFETSALSTQNSAGWWDRQFLNVFGSYYRNLFGQKRVNDFIHEQVVEYKSKLEHI